VCSSIGFAIYPTNQNKGLHPRHHCKSLSEHWISSYSKSAIWIVFNRGSLATIHAILACFWGKKFQFLFPFYEMALLIALSKLKILLDS
jgi:hypothetical protein